MRTEKPEERLRIQMEIDWRSGGQPVLNRRTREPWQDPVQRTVGLRQDQNNRLRGNGKVCLYVHCNKYSFSIVQ